MIIETINKVFDLETISEGAVLYGKHKTWDIGLVGIIVIATESFLVVQYYPSIRNVTNHFRIPVNEVLSGEWEIRISNDLKEITEYTMEDTTDDP